MKFNTNNLSRVQNYSKTNKNSRRKLRAAVNDSVACGFEMLENRCLMSGTPIPFGVSFSSGVLRVNGNSNSETLAVDLVNGKLHATIDHTVYIHPDINTTLHMVMHDAVADYDPAIISKIEFFGNGGNDVITNNTSVKSTEVGGDGDDVLVGGYSDDLLSAGNGNDNLEGRGGNDALTGGAGNDTYTYAGVLLGSDTITEAASVDTDTIDLGQPGQQTGQFRMILPLAVSPFDLSKTTQQTYMAGQLSLTLSNGMGIENLVCSNWSDSITGNGRDNFIYGMGGNDIIHGNGGNDSVDGGAGNDLLYEDAGGGIVWGGDGNNRLYAGTLATDLLGGANDDTLVSIGGSHADSCSGGTGLDSFWLDGESSEKLFDASADEIAKGHVHRVSAFSSNKLVSGNMTTSNTPSRDRLGQNQLDPLADNNLYTKMNFSSKPLFATTGPGVNDIDQNAVGDCYFVSALAAIAKTNPDKIKQLVVDLGDGTYAVNFHNAIGQNAFIRLDADLWTYNSSLAYAGYGAQQSLWVAIIEKAYAMFKNQQGTYASINGGNGAGLTTDQVLGAPKVAFLTTDYANATSFLSAMRTQLLAGKAMTIGGPAPFLPTTKKSNYDNPSTNADENTYHRGAHVYTLISVSADLKSIVVRNPWGYDGGGSDANPNDGYVTLPADLVFYCSCGFTTYAV